MIFSLAREITSRSKVLRDFLFLTSAATEIGQDLRGRFQTSAIWKKGVSQITI
jgi:hypothetical protein